MGGNYGKNVFNQLTEVMAKLDAIESEHKQDRREIKNLTDEVTSLRKENTNLREEMSCLKLKNATLEKKTNSLEKENRILYDDNERMKRILNNDSSNSSIPPSKDMPGKLPNTFNGRKPTKKKLGPSRAIKGAVSQKQTSNKK